jgi:hypothetical protein
MIGYRISLGELRRRIRVMIPTWFDRAATALDELPDRPRSSDFRSLWSEIKDVYIELQHSKCAFCEKPLEGRIEQDVEHFRPKAEVHCWELPPDLIAAGVVVRQPADGTPELGYRFVAYHPFNYAAACKPCNSVLKANLFPLTRRRRTEARRPPALTTEGAYLIYPIGDIDENPETLITFEGAIPIPARASGHSRLRALVTISIFKLDDPVERKVFFQGRARALESLYLNLQEIDEGTDAAVVAAATRNVRRMLRDAGPHANCLRCFRRLYRRSPDEARSCFIALSEFLDTTSPGDGPD